MAGVRQNVRSLPQIAEFFGFLKRVLTICWEKMYVNQLGPTCRSGEEVRNNLKEATRKKADVRSRRAQLN